MTKSKIKLTKYTEKIHNKLEKKHIICFEKSPSYIAEMCEKFDGIEEKIDFIVDPNPRYQTEIKIGEKSLLVCGLNELEKSDLESEKAIVITSDYYMEAFDRLSTFFENSCYMVPETIYYFPNHETEIELFYKEKYEKEPLKDIIVFRSGPHASSYVEGLDFADNARALFEYMLSAGLNRKYELVWIVKDPSEFTSEGGKYYRYYRDYENLTFVAFDDGVSDDMAKRDEYYRVLFLSKWIFMTDAYGFARNCRNNQIRVQLWHGCGFKTRTNFVPCEKRYEYNIVISKMYQRIHAQIYGLRENQVLITGYPKSDWLFHPIPREKMEELGIKEGKCIFWLPTFRVAKDNLAELNENALSTLTGMPLVDTVSDLNELNRMLVSGNTQLIIKLHPFQNRKVLSSILQEDNLTNILLLDNEQLTKVDIQIGQILAYADALISDYSSVAVEYMLLDRPIAFTLDDVAEYENSRGFVFDDIRANLPGKQLYSFQDYLEYVGEVISRVDSSSEKRKELKKKFHYYNDDKSCERVVKMLGI